MAELLTDEIIIEHLEQDGFMQEPDGPWLLEYIYENYGGKLDNTSDFVDDKWTLKIYSETINFDILIFTINLISCIQFHQKNRLNAPRSLDFSF